MLLFSPDVFTYVWYNEVFGVLHIAGITTAWLLDYNGWCMSRWLDMRTQTLWGMIIGMLLERGLIGSLDLTNLVELYFISSFWRRLVGHLWGSWLWQVLRELHLVLTCTVIAFLLVRCTLLFILIMRLKWLNRHCHEIVFKRLCFMFGLIMAEVLIQLLCVSSVS